MARIVSLTVLALLIVFLGVTFYQVVAPFLLPLFLAGVLAVLCQPLYGYFLDRTQDRPRVSAGLTTAAVIAVVLVPLAVGTFVASAQLYSLTTERLAGKTWNEAARELRTELRIDSAIGVVQRQFPQLTPEELQKNSQSLVKQLAERTLGIAGKTIGTTIDLLGAIVALLIGLFTFVLALYYFLADGPALISSAEQLIPVEAGYQRQLLTKFTKVVRAVVLATFVAAIAQGVLTAAAVYGAGLATDTLFLQHFFIFFIVSTVVSMIPLAGAWLVWAPIALWLAVQQHWGAAIFLTLFGSVVVGTTDNLVRTYVLHSDTKLHPLLAFVSVLGGLQEMGLWGVFVGPMVASLLHALVKIFNSELGEFSKERFPDFGASDADDASRGSGAKPSDREASGPQEVESEPAAQKDERADSGDSESEPAPQHSGRTRGPSEDAAARDAQAESPSSARTDS